jgi:hypothetical protein
MSFEQNSSGSPFGLRQWKAKGKYIWIAEMIGQSPFGRNHYGT